MFSMVGPLDKPGMDINGMIESVSLNLSPPVVRLIIHAVKALIPQKVCTHVCTNGVCAFVPSQTTFFHGCVCMNCNGILLGKGKEATPSRLVGDKITGKLKAMVPITRCVKV